MSISDRMKRKGPETALPAAAAGAPAPPSALLSGVPSLLGFARLADRRVLEPGAVEFYRHIGRLVEMGPATDFLLVPSGRGTGVMRLAELTGANGVGVDPDPSLVRDAAAKAREIHGAHRLQFESAALEDLPYQDAVFDLAIGEIGLAGATDPAAAVRELTRVTRPGGTVILVQLSWSGDVKRERREALAAQLGVRPMLLVAWKQLLRDAGVVELHVEDWSESALPVEQSAALGELAAPGTLRGRAAVLFRAWRRWGWGGAMQAMQARGEIRALVGRERVLSLSLIRGTRWHSPIERPE